MQIITDVVGKNSEAAEAEQGLRVLIVDDEPHVRTYLRTMLRKLGVTVGWDVGSGGEALEVYASEWPDVVLLDINLPHMGGPEILRRMIALDPEAAVLVVSSDQSLDTVKAASELGAIGYVLKHLPPAKIEEILRETLSQIEPRPR